MSKLTGGLFSRPSGKNSGLVFASARTSRGKQATARGYTIPSQPNSPGQLLTKQKMAGVAFVYNQLPEQMRLHDLKNFPGAVSGYVALSKMFMPIVNYPPVNQLQRRIVDLGSLHLPRAANAYREPFENEFTPRWSTELEGNASPDDTISFFDVSWSSAIMTPSDLVTVAGIDVATRSDGGVDLPVTGLNNAVGFAFFYFRSAVNGELSPAVWQQPSDVPP